MLQKIKAVYWQGAFIPTEYYELPDDTKVEITINLPQTCSARSLNYEMRKKFRQELLQRMRSKSIRDYRQRFVKDKES
ncbi:antitoxin AF2212-like protein [Crocosphaera sp. UHCC 0190]|uniref:antitoxin AF2212-like protein n=1 Tax=Crocosphaera sp. UHCC 0190 TaxID=3110246 RepID=UPI002B1FCF51|nr:antitoxin AF2212-like protein [Crocosphaera sp. UHCC 0190]MEA5511862.1 antitoxin AF2212-like protein [Crocosphaera sp. UHCC 0190]